MSSEACRDIHQDCGSFYAVDCCLDCLYNCFTLHWACCCMARAASWERCMEIAPVCKWGYCLYGYWLACMTGMYFEYNMILEWIYTNRYRSQWHRPVNGNQWYMYKLCMLFHSMTVFAAGNWLAVLMSACVFCSTV